jgi:hypothetical protein
MQNQQGQGISHATGGSHVPDSVQKKAPIGLEESLPNPVRFERRDCIPESRANVLKGPRYNRRRWTRYARKRGQPRGEQAGRFACPREHPESCAREVGESSA